MISVRDALLPAIAAMLFLISGTTIAAAEVDRVEARFEIFGFAGLHVLTDRTTVEERAEAYAIATDLDTRGLASVFVDLRSHSEVHGRLIRDETHPFEYRADMRTVDQLTAYFIVERQLAQRGTCALVVPVFDGSGLYKLRFTDGKRETLSADGYQNFAGPTQVCEVVREEIPANPDRNEDTYRRGKIWYARMIAGDRMVPVRMEFDTAFGGVKGYLAELHGRGVNLHLVRE